MTMTPPTGRAAFVGLLDCPHPLAFVASRGAGASDPDPIGRWSYRAEVMGIGRFQKECLAEDLATGRVWRLAADEGKYLRGTGLAPSPLMHWAAGLHSDLVHRFAQALGDAGIGFTSLGATVSQGFASDGSFAKGQAVARVYDLRIAVDVAAEGAQGALTAAVERTVDSSPAVAALLHPAEGAFSLSVNGRRVPVRGVPQSTAPGLVDPFRRHAGQPAPTDDEPLAPDLHTTRPGSDGGIVLSDDQSGALGWRVEAVGQLDLSNGLIEATVGFPEAAMSETWSLVSDPSNLLAPSGLLYFSAGTAFCYHTQLCRYADVRRMAIEFPRLVQSSTFASDGTRATADAVDTQLFLNGTLDDAAAGSLLVAAANTCYAHRALSTTITRPTPELNGNPADREVEPS